MGRLSARLGPIAFLVLLSAACGGGGKKAVTATNPQVTTRIYLVRDGKVAPVERVLPVADSPDLLRALEAGPTPAERRAGFTTALLGGSSRLGLAQVVYTLSAHQPTRAVTYRGTTYRRADFEAETPVILVESPLPFSHVTSPLRVAGTANTYEATFQYELLEASGKVLASHFVTATSGTGVRGTFAFTARFDIPKAVAGKLVVYENSAADGRRIHQSKVPLTLEP
jgi:Immunoglobulin-like domain of bacterial spore germination